LNFLKESQLKLMNLMALKFLEFKLINFVFFLFKSDQLNDLKSLDIKAKVNNRFLI